MARNAARIGWVPMMSRARFNMAFPRFEMVAVNCGSAGVAPRRTELLDHARGELGRRRWRVVERVVESHRLPFEGAELMERLHLDPLDVLHGRDEARDLVDIGDIVG